MNTEKQKKYKGFTLIELLVVVLIIGIIAAIALPQYQLAKDKAKYTQAMNLLASINQAQKRYVLANGIETSNFNDFDIDMPASGKISQAGNEYADTWGYCYLHDTSYGMCAVTLGKTSGVWYFLRWDSTYFSSNKRQCWVSPKNNARGNRLCQALTGKATGTDSADGNYKVYKF